MTETKINFHILKINQNIFNLSNIKPDKGKKLDDDLKDFISQNKSFIESKISTILKLNSDNVLESKIRNFFLKKKNYSIKIEIASILFLILFDKNELTGPELKEISLLFMDDNTYRKTTANFDDDSIINKRPSTRKLSSKAFSLDENFRSFLKETLDEQIFDISHEKYTFQLNSYRPLGEPTEGKIDLDFFPFLNNEKSSNDQWIDVNNKIKEVRNKFSRIGQPQQPKFFFDTFATHESIGFIIGYHLYKFKPSINQFNRATESNEYWTIIPADEDSDYQRDWDVEKINDKQSNEIVVIINISSSIKGGVIEFLKNNNLVFPIYSLTLKSGIRDSVIKDNQDANNKLHSLIQFLENLKSESFIKQVHLFFKGPLAFSCMLGTMFKRKFVISLYQRKPVFDDFYFTLDLGKSD